MNADQARALFDRALDGELDAEQRAALDTALEKDAELAAEFAQLKSVQRAATALRQDVAGVDLLAGVQQKLRARSGGKFYRDRFAEQGGRNARTLWVLLAASVLMIAVAVWFALESL